MTITGATVETPSPDVMVRFDGLGGFRYETTFALTGLAVEAKATPVCHQMVADSMDPD